MSSKEPRTNEAATTWGPFTVRRAALEILVAVDSSRSFVDELVTERLGDFEPRDRHLLQEISYGTVRHRNTLDRILSVHLRRPAAAQRPPVRSALRLGTYQLVYLKRVPAHAALNQTLEAMKAMKGVHAGDVGFVNAVLHKLKNEIRRKTDDSPAERDDPNILPIRTGYCHFTRPVLPLYRLGVIDHLSIKFSHPRWLVGRWLERYGEEETRELLEANNHVPLVTARVSGRAPSLEAVLESLNADGFTASAGPIEASVVIHRGGDLGESGAWKRGWIQVQDVTAIRLGAAMRLPRGARVLDLCSAPGGKAVQLLDAAGDAGHVVAADRSEERLALVRQNLGRLGDNFNLVHLPDDPAEIDLGERFTHVLLDVPCSNTGVFARRPDARWRLGRKDLKTLSELQSRLLEAALRHLAPGGRLLYATCSLEPEENEERVADFTRRHPELTELESRLFLPHRSGGDGGYFSLLCRAT